MSAPQLQFAAWYTQVVCCNCGISFFVPNAWDRDRHSDRANFWCPNGHQQHYTEGEVAKLKKALEAETKRREWAETRRDDWKREAEHQDRRARTYKGHLTRTRKRVAAGVCPCCRRTFQQLARHMANQHPEFAKEEAP